MEFWVRNPHNYIRECVATQQNKIAFDAGVLIKLNLDPQIFASMYFPADFRCLSIGDKGAVETTREHSTLTPKAVYPTWRYGVNDIPELEAFCAEDWEGGVSGQERRVVITHLPITRGGMAKKFLLLLKEIQDDYPKAIIHIHGTYAWNALLGLDFKSADFEVRTIARGGTVLLASGKKVHHTKAMKFLKWLKLIEVPVESLESPSGRCIANILALQWATENWDKTTLPSGTWVPRPMTEEDLERYLNGAVPEPRPHIPTRNVHPALPGDKLACDYCSLARECRSYRVGSICTLPKSSGLELYEYFESRDTDAIMMGLAKIMAIDADRLKDGREMEKEFGELSKEVTGISKDLFNKGVQLARLVDPALRSGGINVNVSQNNNSVSLNQGGTPQMEAAKAIELLEQNGIPRVEITSDMVHRTMAGEQSRVVAEYHDNLPVLDVAELDS